MTLDPQNPNRLDPIEDLMLEAGQARRAGVFGRTAVDAKALLGSPGASWFQRHREALVGFPIAACLAFVAFASVLHYHDRKPTDSTRVALPGSLDSMTSQAALCNQAEVMLSCFTGPGRDVVSNDCADADFDSDGDVDLADFRELQFSGNPRP